MIKINRKKFVIHSVIAISFLLLIGILYSFGIMKQETLNQDNVRRMCSYSMLFWLLSFIDEKEINDQKKQYISLVLFFITPFIALVVSNDILQIPNMNLSIVVLNYLLYFGIQLLCFIIIPSIKISTLVGITIVYVCNIINEIIYLLRGSFLRIFDLYAIDTAKNVAGQYKIKIGFSILTGTLIYILIMFCIIKYSKSFQIKAKKYIVLIWFVSIIMVGIEIVGFSNMDVKKFPEAFVNNMLVRRKGFALNLVGDCLKLNTTPPEDYNKQEVEKLLAQYQETKTAEKKPTIIAIMNESYSDLSVLGEFKTNEPYMPYYNELTKNTVKGNMWTSVFGGGTCNTEFEFLTGCSMSFLPRGCYPYQQYVHNKKRGLVSYLNDLGYNSIAIHPCWASGWNRTQVYSDFGFSDFISGEDFSETEEIDAGVGVPFDKCFGSDLDYVRNYISDKESYDKIIQLYENKKDDPLFIFNVTMQNHGSYDYNGDDFTETIKVTGEKEYPETNEYLSLIRESDDALKYLIEYFSKVKEPVVIVMFGDHQPILNDGFTEEIEKDSGSAEDIQKKFTVPFMIWANYDIEEKEMDTISPNFLSLITLDVANLPQSTMNQYLKTVYEEYPANNINGAKKKGGGFVDSTIFNEDETYLTYQKVQYYYLFDKKTK